MLMFTVQTFINVSACCCTFLKYPAPIIQAGKSFNFHLFQLCTLAIDYMKIVSLIKLKKKIFKIIFCCTSCSPALTLVYSKANFLLL